MRKTERTVAVAFSVITFLHGVNVSAVLIENDRETAIQSHLVSVVVSFVVIRSKSMFFGLTSSTEMTLSGKPPCTELKRK